MTSAEKDIKTCSKCFETKELIHFRKRKLKYSYGYYAECLVCSRSRNKQHRDKYKEILNAKRREQYKAIEIKVRKYEYVQQNKERFAARNREYKRCYVANRKKDPLFKLQNNLRIRLITAIKQGSKAGSAVKDLGCSIEELKQYLESKFQPGMSWDNWGRHGWHIDHIKPLSRFDLSNREEFLKACHYTNLQPLWAIDNIRKGNKHNV
jgi:hypothetical protein